FAWIMTRERTPPGPVIQAAYGVLDQFDISRNFFVKTDQEKCDIAPAVPDVIPSNPQPITTPDVIPSNPQPITTPETRSPSKEMLPPEPSENKNDFIQNSPDKTADSQETLVEPVKEEVVINKDEKNV
ncbi:hypothetical protein L9F63_026218, partial [Diploptera punctata]